MAVCNGVWFMWKYKDMKTLNLQNVCINTTNVLKSVMTKT